MLSEVHLNRSVEDAAQHVMEGFGALELHADVVNGVHRLQEDGFRLVTLSNGATSVADRLLTAGGIRDRFEQLLSVEQAGAWKPAPAAYAYAVEACGVPAEEMVLVACHPWDVDGARRAGLAVGLGEPLRVPVPRDVPRPDVHGERHRRPGRPLGLSARTSAGLGGVRPRHPTPLDHVRYACSRCDGPRAVCFDRCFVPDDPDPVVVKSQWQKRVIGRSSSVPRAAVPVVSSFPSWPQVSSPRPSSASPSPVTPPPPPRPG